MNPRFLKHGSKTCLVWGCPWQAAALSFRVPLPMLTVGSRIRVRHAVGLQEEQGRRVAYFCHWSWGISSQSPGPCCALVLISPICILIPPNMG